MRPLGLLALLALSACSVERITDRNSGVGISNSSTITATESAPAIEGDYRAQLFEDLKGS